MNPKQPRLADFRSDILLAAFNIMLAVALAIKPESNFTLYIEQITGVSHLLFVMVYSFVLLISAGVIVWFKPPGQYYAFATIPAVVLLSIIMVTSLMSDDIALTTGIMAFALLILLNRDWGMSRRLAEAELALQIAKDGDNASRS